LPTFTLSRSRPPRAFTIALDVARLDDESVRWDYSGRYMYGRTCFGLVCSLQELSAFLVALGAELGEAQALEDDETAGEVHDLVRALLSDVSSDNMGLNMIWYFEDVEVTT